MVKLMATASYPYAGISVRSGEVFEASEHDANLLKLVGRAVDAPSAIRTRDLSPEDAPDVDPSAPKPKRQYKRRDLQAEG